MNKTITTGAVVGFALGAVVFIGYTLASWWVCFGLRSCPAHWFPYAIVFLIGVSIFTIVGATTATILRRLYQLLRVDG